MTHFSYPIIVALQLLLNFFFYCVQLITLVGVALNGANVIGYVKCRRDAGAKLTQMAGQFIGKQILNQTLQQSDVQL